MDPKIIDEKFEEIWKDLLLESDLITPQERPAGYVLGGQPGAGKSYFTKTLLDELWGNAVVINADNYRKYHPDYIELQKDGHEVSVDATAAFAGNMAEKLLGRALDGKYNVIIEGTFRTSETPCKTLRKMKDSGYRTHIRVQTCPAELSWESCQERYRAMLALNPDEARVTKRESHDTVVKNLPENIGKVIESGLADDTVVATRNKAGERQVMFDSRTGMAFSEKALRSVLDGPGSGIEMKVKKDGKTIILSLPQKTRRSRREESCSYGR